MKKKRFFQYATTLSVGVFLIVALLLSFTATTVSAECKNRGDLDVRYCDEDGDLVADAPTDASQFLDPSVLVFSYTPVEDPSVYENVFTEFMEYLAKKTGKKV
ncbi:MAG: hypothetical protein DSY89_03790, partial [Deltaproteobacteria bacterium]